MFSRYSSFDLLTGDVRPASPTGRSFAYEGDIRTSSRVAESNYKSARGGIRKSRAKTVKGKFAAAKRKGARLSVGKAGNTTLKKEVQGRKLTAGEVRNRTKARAAKRNAGTAAGRRTTRGIIGAARRQGAAGSMRGLGY